MGYIGNQPAETPIVEILETDFKIGEDDQTKIDFADANTINFHANNAKEMVLVENSLSPGTSDGTALGTTSLMWSDLFLASGSVINLNNGNVTITHSSNTLTVAAATVAFTASTAVTVSNDLKLSSDSAILSLGADDDATFTHDGTTGLTIAATPISIDSTGELHLNSTTGDIKLQDGGTDQIAFDLDGTAGEVIIKPMVDSDDLVIQQYDGTEVIRVEDNASLGLVGNKLSIANSSSDVVIKPLTDAKDIIFQQYDGTEVARVEDNATFNVVTDKLAINGTAVTATAAELNLIDGGTSVGGSVTVGDSDGFILNDGGTMKTIPASDVKTYAGGSGSIYTLDNEFSLTGGTSHHFNADFAEDADYFMTISIAQQNQQGVPYPYIEFYRDTSGTDTWNGTSRFVSQTHGYDEDTFTGSPGAKITLTGADAQYSGVHPTQSGTPGYFGQFYFHTPRNHSGTNQETDYKCFQGTAGWYDYSGRYRNVQIWCGFGSNGSDGIKSFRIEAASEYPDTDGGKGSSTHSSNNVTSGFEGVIRVFKIDHS